MFPLGTELLIGLRTVPWLLDIGGYSLTLNLLGIAGALIGAAVLVVVTFAFWINTSFVWLGIH